MSKAGKVALYVRKRVNFNPTPRPKDKGGNCFYHQLYQSKHVLSGGCKFERFEMGVTENFIQTHPLMTSQFFHRPSGRIQTECYESRQAGDFPL